MSALIHVHFFVFLFAAGSLGFCQEMDIDLLMSNGGVTYNTTQNNQVVAISIIGPKDPDNVNHTQRIELRIDGQKIKASREEILGIVKSEIANKGEKLSIARQACLSLVMATLLTDLKIKRWGLQLFNDLHEGKWQYAFVERDPLPENYDFFAPYVYEGEKAK